MTTTDLDTVQGDVLPPGRTLFRTDDPAEVLDQARGVADALKTALDDSGMTVKVGRSEHVLIDGWQTLGSMLGVSARTVWSRPLPDGNGWEARAEAVTIDGRVVGAAEGMVTNDEPNWRSSAQYALRSMAQTRAMSKALRGPLGFVVTLAGRSATPAEEMPPDVVEAELPTWATPIDGEAIDRLGGNLQAILSAAGVEDPEGAAASIASTVANYCGGTFPAACATLAHLLAQRVPTATTTPEVTQ